MPHIEIIKAADAPGAPKKKSKFEADLIGAVNGLTRDELLKLAPDADKSIRGLKTGIGRVTKSEGIKIPTWDDGEVVYLSKL